MLHLLKKVYLASDNTIDVNLDRVVISESHGIDTLQSIKVEGGLLISKAKNVDELVGEGKDYTNLTDFFDTLAKFCYNSDKRVVVYADEVNFIKIITYWYKLVFKNITKPACYNLIENMLFKYCAFHRSRITTGIVSVSEFTINTETFNTVFDTTAVTNRDEFIESYKQDLSVEALLATYLNTGQFKEELKSSIKTLMSKDLEKYFYELKEIFFVHILTKRFSDRLGLEKSYTFENFREIINDKSRFADLFLTDRIWHSKFMQPISSGKAVKFENITVQDIANFKEYAVIAGSAWVEESAYIYVKSDVNKLDFLGVFTDFTDELLAKIIDTEATYEHAAGSFFSIDLETVNHYFIQSILDAFETNNQEFLNTYSVI